MCAPAAAALALAVLCALPCRGIDANTTTRLLSETFEKNETRPTLNVIYQMLLIGPNNRTNLNFNVNTNRGDILNCCSDITPQNRVGKDCCSEGAANDTRQVRDVSVIKTNSEFSTRETRIETTTRAVVEKKKKMESGSSAPLLNYIFDAYSNTHAHHLKNERPSPGNSIYAAAAPDVKALVGSMAHLDCKVDALHDKVVSWVRRKNDDQPMELLTTGTQQYTADDRYSARFIPPDIWRLEIRDVRSSDAAAYDCQLSAHPPRTARVTLSVPEVSVRIIDNAGADVSEQVCEQGSTVALRCEVRGIRMEGGPALLWYRRDDLLNDDTTRGGISVRTEFGANGANSVLRVARVRADDAGRYSCSVAHSPPVALPPASVLLHVIKGESLAELHQGAPRLSASAITVSLLALYSCN